MNEPAQPFDDRVRRMTALWTAAQPAVRSFVYAAVRQPQDTEDLVQQVAATVIEKFDDFETGTNFNAWALAIARHKIMNHRTVRSRERHVFDSDTLASIADAYAPISAAYEDRRDALHHCMQLADERGRRMLDLRYQQELTPAQIAKQLNTSAQAVHAAMYRLRKRLADCIEDRLASSEATP